MKTVLIILTKGNQSDLTTNESIAALMLFASFGIEIHVLFRDAALTLLNQPEQINESLKLFLKPSYKMVESFEFYDIESLYICEEDSEHPWVTNSALSLKPIRLNTAFIQQFDHIITW